MKPETCDGCGKIANQWTIAKGFDLLCDSCLLHRLAQSHDMLGTCDWGDCDETATATRWDETGQRDLPVCKAHSSCVVPVGEASDQIK